MIKTGFKADNMSRALDFRSYCANLGACLDMDFLGRQRIYFRVAGFDRNKSFSIKNGVIAQIDILTPQIYKTKHNRACLCALLSSANDPDGLKTVIQLSHFYDRHLIENDIARGLLLIETTDHDNIQLLLKALEVGALTSTHMIACRQSGLLANNNINQATDSPDIPNPHKNNPVSSLLKKLCP